MLSVRDAASPARTGHSKKPRGTSPSDLRDASLKSFPRFGSQVATSRRCSWELGSVSQIRRRSSTRLLECPVRAGLADPVPKASARSPNLDDGFNRPLLFSNCWRCNIVVRGSTSCLTRASLGPDATTIFGCRRTRVIRTGGSFSGISADASSSYSSTFNRAAPPARETREAGRKTRPPPAVARD